MLRSSAPCLAFALLVLCSCAGAQEREAGVPASFVPRLAASTWPVYHGDLGATASSRTRGPGVVRQVQTVDALTARRLRRPWVSPWALMAEPYADGSQAVITTPNDGVAKYLIHGDRFEAVDFLDLDRRDRDFDWGIVLLAGHLGVVTERKHNRFVVFGDARPGPRSPLEVKARIPIDERRYGALTAHHSLAPSGHLIALTSADRLIAVDLRRGAVVASFDLPTGGGFSYHNSFPIDERGRIFLSTQAQMIAVDWDGRRFQTAWTAAYDMRGPGCEGTPPAQSRLRERLAVMRGRPCTGTGTTPTILGARDGVVVIVDGHAPRNNLVAFWQSAPPPGWRPVERGGRRLDRQVAGVLALPYSTPQGDGFTAENSPAALGNGVVIAQWAGFRPARDAPRGVQRVDWNPRRRALELAWAAPDVHFNGVPTIACDRGRSCQTYGMGWDRDAYAYTSLDFETGAVTGRVRMAPDRAVLDQGNGHAVAEDGSIVYSGRYSVVRVR